MYVFVRKIRFFQKQKGAAFYVIQVSSNLFSPCARRLVCRVICNASSKNFLFLWKILSCFAVSPKMENTNRCSFLVFLPSFLFGLPSWAFLCQHLSVLFFYFFSRVFRKNKSHDTESFQTSSLPAENRIGKIYAFCD